MNGATTIWTTPGFCDHPTVPAAVGLAMAAPPVSGIPRSPAFSIPFTATVSVQAEGHQTFQRTFAAVEEIGIRTAEAEEIVPDADEQSLQCARVPAL